MVTATMDSVIVIPGTHQQQMAERTIDPARSGPSNGLVFVFKPPAQLEAMTKTGRSLLPEEIRPTNVKSRGCFKKFWFKLSEFSFPQCKWQFYAILAICFAIGCIVSATLFLKRQDLLQMPTSEDDWLATGVVSSPPKELPTLIISPPDGADRLPNPFQASAQSKDTSTSDSDEEMADEPGAPSTSDSNNCQSVTYGDDAILNCPRANVLNLTVTSNKGYNSLGGFLAQFPKLQALTLDFQNFCPQASAKLLRENTKVKELALLEELRIINSKSCENLSSALTFKLPKLVRLHMVNTRLDLELNQQILYMIEDACRQMPQGTFQSVIVWHSDICKKCGFEYDKCGSEPIAEHCYTTYFG